MGAGESPPISPHLEEAKDRCRPLLKGRQGHLAYNRAPTLQNQGKETCLLRSHWDGRIPHWGKIPVQTFDTCLRGWEDIEHHSL